MGRLVAEHFNNRGVPKRAFASQKEAWKWLDKEGRTGLYGYYRCPLCSMWHLTTKKGKRGSRRFP